MSRRSRLRCRKCRGSDISLLSVDNNVRTKKSTSLNLNPLKPFTVFNHKEKRKKKRSKGKLGLAVATGGLSLLFTGTKKNKGNEYFCRDCGNRWIGK